VIADATDPDAIQTILADLKQGVPTMLCAGKTGDRAAKRSLLPLPDG